MSEAVTRGGRATCAVERGGRGEERGQPGPGRLGALFPFPGQHGPREEPQSREVKIL